MVNKTALVTGAAAGIGKACALRLAKDGISVGVLDLDLAACEQVVKEIEAEGGRAMALQANVCNRQQVSEAARQLRESFGLITIVVNNAGAADFTPFEEISDEAWDRIFEINAKGTFIVTQVTVPDMKEARWGRIINISSSSAQTGTELQVHYAAAKGAVIAFTRSLAQALGPYGITVNNIPPGTVMNTVMSEANKTKFAVNLEDLEKKIPVGRTGVPEDIANACSWLASDETSYVTGQTIGVNGGRVVS